MINPKPSTSFRQPKEILKERLLHTSKRNYRITRTLSGTSPDQNKPATAPIAVIQSQDAQNEPFRIEHGNLRVEFEERDDFFPNTLAVKGDDIRPNHRNPDPWKSTGSFVIPTPNVYTTTKLKNMTFYAFALIVMIYSCTPTI